MDDITVVIAIAEKIEDNGHKNYLLLDSQILSHSIQCDAYL